VNPTRRLAVLILAIIGLALAAWFLPLHAVPGLVGHLGTAAPVVGVLVGAVLLIALVPRTPVSLACGLLFGAAAGAVCALLVALLAAAVTFAAGRLLGREFVVRHSGARFARLESWITREGMLAVAAVRALPIGPYGLVGYAYGASAIRTRHYTAGTLISAAPSAVTYALLGAAVAEPGHLRPLALLPLGLGLALSAAVLIRSRAAARARTAHPGPAGVEEDPELGSDHPGRQGDRSGRPAVHGGPGACPHRVDPLVARGHGVPPRGGHADHAGGSTLGLT
jgi:uncharacterized membrane protein YdjX (TVP38/TMEM64 family)